jgi:hypothetical protein
LGMRIDRDRNEQIWFLVLVDSIWLKWNFLELQKYMTDLMWLKWNLLELLYLHILNLATPIAQKDEMEASVMKGVHYASSHGPLMYAVATCLDIAHTVRVVSH